MNRGGEEQLQRRGGGDGQDGGGGGGGGGVGMGRRTGDSGANRKHTPHPQDPTLPWHHAHPSSIINGEREPSWH